jgi:starch synthase
MYSLRYGAVPIVRATGGLVDTVEDYDPARDDGTGFRFGPPRADALVGAVDRALASREDAPRWRRLVRRGMEKDFGWERSAAEYVRLYERARRLA